MSRTNNSLGGPTIVDSPSTVPGQDSSYDFLHEPCTSKYHQGVGSIAQGATHCRLVRIKTFWMATAVCGEGPRSLTTRSQPWKPHGYDGLPVALRLSSAPCSDTIWGLPRMLRDG